MSAFFSGVFPIQDPVLIFAVVMLIILLAPLISTRARIPGIVGIIIAGALLGPSALGILARDQTIVLLGTVGLLYLMFLAGISLDLNQFARYRSQSITFGVISYCLPHLLSLLVACWIFGYSLPAGMLIGAIVGSHTLLAYPIAQRLGLAKNRTVTMTVGGTLLTDSLSLSVLAIVTASVTGNTGVAFWVTFVGIVFLYVWAVFRWLHSLTRWFFRFTHDQIHLEFVFLLALLFSVSYLAQLAGLAPIIGAFLAGLTTNRMVPESSVLMSRLRFVGEVMFIPFFLISVGMLVDFKVLVSSIEVWVVALMFIGIVVVGKCGAAKLVQIFFKNSSAEGWLCLGLSVPQAAATLAVTLVTFDLEIFTASEVSGVLIMILFTCILGPWLVEKYGREVALSETLLPYRPLEAPQRILVPLANPASIRTLMDLALFVRDPGSDQPLYPLTVVDAESNIESEVAASERMLSQAMLHGMAANIPVNPLTRVDFSIAVGISRAITERLATTVILGWNGIVPAYEKIFGSIIDQLLSTSQQLILIAKAENPFHTCNRLLLIIPPYAEREDGFVPALQTIRNIASQIGTPVKIFGGEQTIEQALPFFKSKESEIKVDALPTPNLHESLRAIVAEAQSEDLLIIVSARNGALSWQPVLNRTPGSIAKQLPEQNFVILYPPEFNSSDTKERVTADITVVSMIAPERIAVSLHGNSTAGLLANLLQQSQPSLEGKPLEELVERLINSTLSYVPRFAKAAVLYQAHTSEVPAPQLFVGLCRDAEVLLEDQQSVELLLVLLSPQMFPMEEHLKLVGRIVRVFRNPDVSEQLTQTTSVEEALVLLTT